MKTTDVWRLRMDYGFGRADLDEFRKLSRKAAYICLEKLQEGSITGKRKADGVSLHAT